MSTPFEIPLSANPQIFIITLNQIDYNINLYWCDPANCWVIDISDTSGNKILSGIPLVTGVDLLEPYSYLNFGGQLIVQTDHTTLEVPTFDNLGTNGHLYWVTQ